MKITVLGASGNFGADVADVLEGRGHTVVRASRSTGVDAVAGSGVVPGVPRARPARRGRPVGLDGRRSGCKEGPRTGPAELGGRIGTYVV